MIGRRAFFAIFLTPRMMVLEAIAAPKMPQTILVPGSRLQGAVFEHRRYSAPIPITLFRRAGLDATPRSRNSYLFAFPSLADRQRKWDALASDPEWRGMHPTEISIYRRIA